MALSYPPSVRLVSNGNDVEASVTNQAAQDLTARTDWLKDQVAQLTAGTQLVLRSRTIIPGLVDGTPVYFNLITNRYEAANAAVNSDTYDTAAENAFVDGVVVNVSGATADVVVNGEAVLTMGQWNAVFDTGTAVTGPVFLSATVGKLSTSPGSLALCVGVLHADGKMVMRLVQSGPYLNHVHIERTLLGQPAGTVVDPAFGGTQSVNTPNIAVQGWLPANNTYFPGFVVGVQIPTGAKFGYNVQHASEAALRAVFPFLPPSNAQFVQGGLVLPTTQVVANEYGLWWMLDTYGNAPWPVDYAATSTAKDITAWTSRLTASVSLSDTIKNEIYNELANGVLATMGVTRAIPSNQNALQVTGPNGDSTNGFYGAVTLTNTGVTAVKPRRGLTVTGALGDATLGWRGLVTIDNTIELQARFLSNSYSLPQTTATPLVTTNGVASGTLIGLVGYGLGAGATDFVDFLFSAGDDIETAVNYQLTVKLRCFVDTPAGATIVKNVDMSFYPMDVGSFSSTASFVRTATFNVNEGTPGVMQHATIGPFADVILTSGRTMLIRVLANTGITPVAAGTLRICDVICKLTRV